MSEYIRITKVEILRLKLPLKRSFVTSFGRVDAKETVITKLHSADGMVGYGESAALSVPLFNSETTDTCIYMTKEFIAPALLGKRFAGIEDYLATLPHLPDIYTAKTGPECAFWHLLAQRDNTSIKQLLGGTKNEIPVGESIDIKDSAAELLAEIEQRLSEGYQRIKVKIKPGYDVEPLYAVRSAWPDIPLTADANASYDLAKHKRELLALDQFDLIMLEQPLAPRDLADAAALQRQIQTPICLDESICELADLRTAAALGSGKIVNLKPMRVGGLQACLDLSEYALKHDISVWCGGMFETGIGRAFNIALASNESFTHPADMSPYQLFFSEDIIEPSYVVKANGCIDVPDTPGLGYQINDSQIDAFTTEKIVVTA